MDIIHYTDNSKESAPRPPAQINLPSNTPPAAPAAAERINPVLLVDNDVSLAYANTCLPPGWTCLRCDPTNIDAQSYLCYSHAAIWGTKDPGGAGWAQAIARIITIPCYIVEVPDRLPEHWEISQAANPKVVTATLVAAIAKCKARIVEPQPPKTNGTHTELAPRPLAAPIEIPDHVPFIRGGSRGDGAIKPLMANVAMLLLSDSQFFNLRFDEFSQFAYRGDQRLEDEDYIEITEWCQLRGVHADVRVVKSGVLRVATQCRFNQVLDHLDSLKWDGINRLENIFIDHGGAPETNAVRAMTAKWFIQAVARAYRPGCQADHMLILEGAQGLRKSSFFRAIGEPWFTDHLSDLSNKDSRQELRGTWIIEIAELAAVLRADKSAVKSFLTTSKDHYRESYGFHAKYYPRTCVFAATVNPSGGYFNDETGARRFWPIPITTEIDLAEAVKYRDQYWAEAVARYKAGELWYITDQAVLDEIIAYQRARYDQDAWQERVEKFIYTAHPNGEIGPFTVSQILEGIGLRDARDQDQRAKNRVAAIMKFLGWDRRQAREGGDRPWKYFPPEKPLPPL